MKKEFEDQYHVLEEGHWWFRGRRQIVLALVEQMSPDRDSRILEIGCSGGLLLAELRARGYRNLTGIDISDDAMDLCRARELHDIHVMDAQNPTLADTSYDLIIASDVLEHLSDESQALLRWKGLLRPGGSLIVFVPAFTFLWSAHDVANKHFKRYSRSELTRLLTDSGFTIKRSSYWNFMLFLPISLVRILKRHLAPSTQSTDEGDLKMPAGWMNWLLSALLYCENRPLRSGVNWPWGVSVMALCTKTEH